MLPADVVSGWGVATGALDPTRDLLANFQSAGFTYAPTKTALAAIPANTDRLSCRNDWVGSPPGARIRAALWLSLLWWIDSMKPIGSNSRDLILRPGA